MVHSKKAGVSLKQLRTELSSGKRSTTIVCPQMLRHVRNGGIVRDDAIMFCDCPIASSRVEKHCPRSGFVCPPRQRVHIAWKRETWKEKKILAN
jgi:hypothetical protein